MESIKSVLLRWKGTMDVEKNYRRLFETVAGDPHILRFREEHPEATEAVLAKGLPKAVEYLEGIKACENCPGLDKCPTLLAGHTPRLTVDKGSLAIVYQPCPLKREADRRKRQAALIHSIYIPKEILKATFRTIDKSESGRHDALEAAARFVHQYLEDPAKAKGLYLYGPFGVGKTHIMGAILNALAEHKGVESMMVYTPDFFRELKGAIDDRTLDEKLDYIKTVPVLVLDDIGAETITPWIRDDILGSILQRRMMDRLPTLYTSNYDLEELEDHLAYSNKSGTERLKAMRLMERIRPFTVAVPVTGKNRRMS